MGTMTFQNLGAMGRLGNQMHQIAAVVGYAKKYNQQYSFSKWKYEEYFNLKDYEYPCEIDTIIQEADPLSYTEIPSYLPQMGNINFVGYFQSEKYFEHCKKDILDIFKTEETNFNCGFIHQRRTDYISLSSYHTNLAWEYYKEGMDILGYDHYFCFSDDIGWCKENIKDSRIHFIENTSEIEDLKLMQKCKGAVIANSSFSWWGAYLSDSKNVIVPKNWFGPSAGAFRIEDRLCPGWRAI
jgi:hypothetical protein